ncbi:hypothetical protein C4D60_Mb03t16100 [Musa balbisiana]|uniref:Uncharacterized protein n=1 Tax=Musa balbisiana TaxID=52838 RepID=A0A4S8JCP2_MUSBA|nr:hypothetical protein C4D60_Mb03t16100 [Musa balbisiana]
MGDISREDEEDSQGGSPHSHQGSQDLMGQIPPPTPRVKPQSPLLFTPPIRMFPLQRHEEMHPPNDPWMPNSSRYEDVLDEAQTCKPFIRKHKLHWQR